MPTFCLPVLHIRFTLVPVLFGNAQHVGGEVHPMNLYPVPDKNKQYNQASVLFLLFIIHSSDRKRCFKHIKKSFKKITGGKVQQTVPHMPY
jgi:hypothetical protein